MLTAGLLSTGIPFLLPRMHDRYFFPADVITLCLAFILPQTTPCAFLTLFASFLAYYAYLNMRYLLLMKFGACSLIISLVILILIFTAMLHNKNASEPRTLENNS